MKDCTLLHLLFFSNHGFSSVKSVKVKYRIFAAIIFPQSINFVFKPDSVVQKKEKEMLREKIISFPQFC